MVATYPASCYVAEHASHVHDTHAPSLYTIILLSLFLYALVLSFIFTASVLLRAPRSLSQS
ncbi:hypothetical protein BDV27DRAFT_137533 [Aspergillus caelatus]|uniref:Uncharacterized protein n=1 Tax=Aspergillus caelatus TaxID=61420 RepID=A0A5N6ZMY1_9EURO|nr:uncharacterized protein BDV27DRAFT_137533 [Aspergillus caelatus]KAE8358573.1 hypothetical protein BDV27DRAFT_137533 [Aspergillus caelatus]